MQTIDDEEINCEIPNTRILGSSVNIFYCDTLIRLAQISSLACKKVFSYQAVQKGCRAVIGALANLDDQLQALKLIVEPILRLDCPVDPKNLPSSLSLQQTIYLHYAYYNTVLDIHTVLTIPWLQNIQGLTHDLPSPRQVQKSTEVVAKTCRDAILSTTHMQLDASTPLP